MKLKIADILPLYNGLRSLDGLHKNPAEGTQPVFVPFKYTAKFTMLKVALLGLLGKKVKLFEKTLADLQRQYKAPAGEDPASAKVREEKFNAEIQILNEVEHELVLPKFKVTDLNLYDPESNPKGNQIASTIIEQVLPLIEEVPAAAPAASED